MKLLNSTASTFSGHRSSDIKKKAEKKVLHNPPLAEQAIKLPCNTARSDSATPPPPPPKFCGMLPHLQCWWFETWSPATGIQAVWCGWECQEIWNHPPH